MRRGRSACAVTCAFALALLLAACGSTGVVATREVETVGPPVEVAEDAADSLRAGHRQDPRIGRWAQAPDSDARPIRVRIPSIGVDSALDALGIGPDGRLESPDDYDVAGWFSGGVAPGAVGPAIIAGHVDSPTAPAVFARLGALTPGDEVVVTMSDGTEIVFDITDSVQSSKSDFPTADVYSNVPAPELRLITCAGSFDASIGHYTDNLVVFASLRA